METIRQQARSLVESAATSVSRDEKMRKIAQLVEIATFRADAALFEEIVTKVCEHVSDRSKAVRRSVLDFVDQVCRSDKCGRDSATKALEVAAFLAATGVSEGSVGLSTRALRVAARVMGYGRFGRLRKGDLDDDCLADASREQLLGCFKAESESLRYWGAAAECGLALLVRDAEADARLGEKKPKASAKTKAVASALGAGVVDTLNSEPRAKLLDAMGAALSRYFVFVHRELVSAAISALDATADAAAVRTAVTALHAAETLRLKTKQGVVTAAAARLEAALRRAKQDSATDDALRTARAGEPLTRVKRPRQEEEEDDEDEDEDDDAPAAKKPKTDDADDGAVVVPEVPTADIAPSPYFALAPEDRLALVVEILEKRPLVAAPDDTTRLHGTITTLDELRTAVNAAIAAFAPDDQVKEDPAVVKGEQLSAEPKARAKDPRTRRERPRAPLVVVEDVDDAAALPNEAALLDGDAEMTSAADVPPVDEGPLLTAEEAGSLLRPLSERQEQYMRRGGLERVAAVQVDEPGLRRVRDAVVARLGRREIADSVVDADAMRSLFEGLSYEPVPRAVLPDDQRKKRTADEWKAMNAARCDAALTLLFEAFVRGDAEHYEALAAELVQALVVALARGSANERQLFAETLCCLPRLPERAVAALVKATCMAPVNYDGSEAEGDDPALAAKKVLLGLSALRDVAIARPAAREMCATAALDLTRQPDARPDVRDKAIRLASNMLFPVVALQPYVRDFATNNGRLRLAEDDLDVDAVRRELALFVALCIKDLPLLHALVDVVVGRAPTDPDHPARQALDAELPRLAPALASVHGCDNVLQALAANQEDCPARDAIVLRLVELFADLPAPHRGKGLWAGATAYAASRPNGAVNIVAAALADANATQFQQVLPDLLLRLEDDKLVRAFKRAANATPADTSAAPKLDAAQVLVALHHVPVKSDKQVDGVPMKSVIAALGTCMGSRDVFGAAALKDVRLRLARSHFFQALDRMTTPAKDEKRPNAQALPQMLLRTAILAIKMYPSQLSAFVAGTVLGRLVTRFVSSSFRTVAHSQSQAVWTNPPLWKGFLMCAPTLGDENGPNCFPVSRRASCQSQVFNRRRSSRSHLSSSVTSSRSPANLSSRLSASLKKKCRETPPPSPRQSSDCSVSVRHSDGTGCSEM